MPEEKTVNEHILKITGSANIPLELFNGNDYQVLADCSVVEVADKNNEDGTVRRCYKLKMFGEVQLSEKGQTPIKAKVKGQSPSQLLRYALHRSWNIQPEGDDFETYYESRLREIIKEVDNENI